ncbi:MAG: DUF1638 domain-containing protein [Alphaproteobacteria bacterium]|uniref:DUF1638 domain-containing protein n=1 Tax=Pacificispira sp. TaxID=2888761 RepID=UPI001B0410B6|nr:DUF1638 domain-containing protein [Alphaproteobacteria bacterium]MBO6861511.1 DUF1638 domain-containing protein [Alphaproteobacteria bacterium]MEC9265449.1 DUF1638 domain-containing protein [Pseudomonadota bacterium]
MTDAYLDEEPAPDAAPEFVSDQATVLVIACGALAREIVDLIRLNRWRHLAVTCLPAKLHNEPQKIPDRLREKIRANKDRFDKIFVAYADCGTGGQLDRVVTGEGAVRIGGPHCYSFFAGAEAFDAMAEDELGTFYLTDYLARHFDTLILDGMGLRKYPQMRDMLFGNYTRLMYLAQTDDPALERKARAAAEALGLRFEKRHTGYGELAAFMAEAAQ